MKVYVSGPYSKRDTAANVRAAIDAADRLLQHGHAPYVPHLTHFWHLIYPHKWETWINLDLEWVDVCGAMVILEGESEGVVLEIARAISLGIPIYRGVEQFLSGDV